MRIAAENEIVSCRLPREMLDVLDVEISICAPAAPPEPNNGIRATLGRRDPPRSSRGADCCENLKKARKQTEKRRRAPRIEGNQLQRRWFLSGS
jgi:hypothetical protein